MTLPVLLFFVAHAVSPAAVCLDQVPAAAPQDTISELRLEAPPDVLFPLDDALLRSRYVTSDGRVYTQAAIADYVTNFTINREKTTQVDQYTGDWAMMPDGTQVPVDRELWLAAGARAREISADLKAEVAGLSPAERFQKFLCEYNNVQQERLAARRAAEAHRDEAIQARSAADADVPMAAFAVAKHLYEVLGLQPPAPAAQAEDAAAVWAAVQRLGGIDAVVEAARTTHAEAPGERLSMLLAVP